MFTFAIILPLFTGVTLIVPAMLYAYKKIRPLFSVRVNCWFCGVRTVVPYGNFNCWDCPSCEQYNGFKEDGDYNKPIPAQHDERLNFSTPASCQADSSPLGVQSRSQLCSACNYHQLVKVRLLASFTPTQEGQFEAEVEAYQRHLEEVYALCPSCEAQVQRTLLLQDSLLRPHLVGRPAHTRWRVLARYSPPWKQRLALALALAASAAALCVSLALLMTALGREATLAHCTAQLGLDWIGAPPLRLLQPAGFVLAGSSVLLSGRQRLGPVALLLCLLWLLSLSCSQAAALVDPLRLAWSRALLPGATAVMGAAHVWLLARAQLRSGAVRKLVGSRGSSLAGPQLGCSSGNASALADLPELSDRTSSHGSIGVGNRGDLPWGSRPLPDMMSDVHISPDSERSWSTGTWSQPTSVQGSLARELDAGSGDGGGKPLVWPPRLRLQQGGLGPSPSWLAAGAWAVAGRRSSSNTQLLWGLRQSFGLLTPPPSLDGSAKHSDASAAGQRRSADWCFFQQRDAFFSSSPDCTSGSPGRPPRAAEHSSQFQGTTHRGPSQGGRSGYARSSVSQVSSLSEPTGGRKNTGPGAGPGAPRQPPWALGSLLLGMSVALNLVLALFLTARP